MRTRIHKHGKPLFCNIIVANGLVPVAPQRWLSCTWVVYCRLAGERRCGRNSKATVSQHRPTKHLKTFLLKWLVFHLLEWIYLATGINTLHTKYLPLKTCHHQTTWPIVCPRPLGCVRSPTRTQSVRATRRNHVTCPTLAPQCQTLAHPASYSIEMV